MAPSLHIQLRGGTAASVVQRRPHGFPDARPPVRRIRPHLDVLLAGLHVPRTGAGRGIDVAGPSARIPRVDSGRHDGGLRNADPYSLFCHRQESRIALRGTARSFDHGRKRCVHGFLYFHDGLAVSHLDFNQPDSCTDDDGLGPALPGRPDATGFCFLPDRRTAGRVSFLCASYQCLNLGSLRPVSPSCSRAPPVHVADSCGRRRRLCRQLPVLDLLVALHHPRHAGTLVGGQTLSLVAP